MTKLTIVKTGGNVIDDEAALGRFLDDFAAMPGKKILIHGGGKIASRIGAQMGLEPQYIDGRRITDADTLQLVTMVYGGLINRQIVAKLQVRRCNAIGLTGADGKFISATRRPSRPIDYGQVGDTSAEMVNTTGLQSLLRAGFCPVFAPLTCDARGNLLNTNADTIASVLAQAMAPFFEVSLLYCFEVDGILEENEAGEKSVVPLLNYAKYRELQDADQLSGGILPKIDTALEASEAGVKMVWIGSSTAFAHQKKGTIVVSE